MTSLHLLNKFFYISFFILVLNPFILESCKNQSKNKIITKKEVVFKDFIDFPNQPFNQINFNKSKKDNQINLLNNGFILKDDNTFFRQTDSTTIFSDNTFHNFIIYLKGKVFINQSKLLYDLIKDKSYKSIGTPVFTEFKLESQLHNYYSILFFKRESFIRLSYKLKATRG